MITLDKQQMIEAMLNRHKITDEEAGWLAEQGDETVNYRFDCVMTPAELRSIEAEQIADRAMEDAWALAKKGGPCASCGCIENRDATNPLCEMCDEEVRVMAAEW